jgi:hypothetical protein
MTKSQYLVDPDVNNFINWLGPFLDVGFTHTYTLPNGTLWSCSSIYDAFLNYNWGNNNFSTTAIKLSAIKRIYDYGVLTNDIEIYPSMIYFKYKETCAYKETYKNKEVLVPIIVDNNNINDQLTNISIPLFYDVITKIYKVQYFDFQFQNEIKTFVNNFIVMCNKYITTQQVNHPKQYYLNRTKKKKDKK